MNKPISIVPVILCGGSGTRLWPLSRTGFPKQFLVVSGKQTLFQDAFLRLQGLADSDIQIAKTLIVTNEEHRFLALDQLSELQVNDQTPCEFLLEPESKNTAPALTLAAFAASQGQNDPILVITPADQTIQDQAAFTKAMQKAIRIAHENKIVILGIQPTKAETGYGYIQVADKDPDGSHPVRAFIEKPNFEKAKNYLKTGNYFWNSGIFVLKTSVWFKALTQFRGDIAKAVNLAWDRRQIDQMRQPFTFNQTADPEQSAKNTNTIAFIRPSKDLFAKVLGESIDYAVMEKCPGSSLSIGMVSLDAGWSDLGAWDAVWQVANQDADGNASMGDVLTMQTKDTLVIAQHRLVSTVGVENLIVVETADAVLVANKANSQLVKIIVSQLEKAGREEKNLHRKVHRPWGWYDNVEEGERFKVKRIQVKPGACLSLQMHYHRAEHWVVVKGVAEIINGDKKILLKENQSTYIPQGQTHRLCNSGEGPLEIIEIQSGDYLGEDDIVRFEDTYGRA